MANSLLTIDMITREALRLFINSNAFLKNVDRQYDDQFARTGAKIGDTLRIRLPNDYTVRTGKTASIQDTVEQNRSLTVSTQQGVDLSFSSAERALKLDDFSDRVLRPAMNNLAGAVALSLMGNAESVSNMIFKDNGSGGIATPDASTWLLAGAKLDNNSAPRDRRKIMLDALTQARTVSSLAGLFNPQQKISGQFSTGEMSRDTLGFDWYMDQTVLKRTNGTFTAGTVNGAGQTGTTLTTKAITGTLNKGDVITIAGVLAVNRVTKQSTGELQQFVVTANVASGATSIPIYPAITPGNVAYATVTASPANGAALTLIGGAGVTFRKNLAYYPEAFTLATADLELPRGVHEASRQVYDGISMRAVTAYNVTSDDFITRLDILYGHTTLRPEWGVAVADVL
ncbi:hypothetical protein FA220_03880 [Pseudomonas aeruginosa]|nr:hypothetical protein [Pseudomonas aeruginosa]MCO2796100.1 hypothetical protein [Pseudomonas aeruginosa]MCO3206203.1 hypothetical protein [Pseudomonas aeruginosa]MDV6762841.1 hypothetical protein [Pseudomonas aeruginosa]MDV6829129.1 hypothetical protein [Pseudomonas aeruginosa]